MSQAAKSEPQHEAQYLASKQAFTPSKALLAFFLFIIIAIAVAFLPSSYTMISGEFPNK